MNDLNCRPPFGAVRALELLAKYKVCVLAKLCNLCLHSACGDLNRISTQGR